MIIKRFVAYLIDIMIATGILYLYAICFGTKDKVSGGYSFNGAWGWFIGFGILFFYFFIQEFYWKKTIGKRLFNLEVVKVDSSKLEASDVFKRRILDILELYFIPLIAFVIPLTNEREQRLGDRWANTMVITSKKKADTLFHKTKTQNPIKSLNIYASSLHGQIIFAPISKNFAGIRYEQDECFVCDFPISDLLLGEYALKYFDLFNTQDKNLREHNSTDWPAFRYSKVKTVRSFEADYIGVSVTGLDENNHTLRIEGLPYKDSDLSVSSMVSAHTEPINIGDQINKLIAVCLSGKFL